MIQAAAILILVGVFALGAVIGFAIGLEGRAEAAGVDPASEAIAVLNPDWPRWTPVEHYLAAAHAGLPVVRLSIDRIPRTAQTPADFSPGKDWDYWPALKEWRRYRWIEV